MTEFEPISRRRGYHKNIVGATKKQCAVCGQVKPLTEFYRVGKSYHNMCKVCASLRRKELYEANKEHQNAQARKLHADKVTSLKTPCVICGESRLVCIDFHHVDPERKLFCIGVGSHTDEETAAELTKCVCICSNCHRDFHHTYGANPVNPVQAWDEYYSTHHKL